MSIQRLRACWGAGGLVGESWACRHQRVGRAVGRVRGAMCLGMGLSSRLAPSLALGKSALRMSRIAPGVKAG